MKNKLIAVWYILIILTCVYVLFGKPVQAGYVEHIQAEKIKIVMDKAFRNRTGFKWTPTENPDVRCIMVQWHGEASLACYEVKEER